MTDSTSSLPDNTLTFSEEGGIRYMHFGSDWIQGGMRIRKPWWPEFTYTQQMMAWLLFADTSQALNIVQLGLGAGSLTKACYHLAKTHYPQWHITAIDYNDLVILSAHTMFALPKPDKWLDILHTDALRFVQNPEHHGTAHVLQIDLYDASADGPTLDSEAFYRACWSTLKDNGWVCVNIFGAQHQLPQSILDQNINALCNAFNNRVLLFPETEDGNVVAIGFKGDPVSISWHSLQEHATNIQNLHQYPAKRWVRQLKAANVQDRQHLTI